ncbi:uncharacterized protein BDZ99DRAFT_547564 [Mytilinidion resinicola]|uniref:Uncharacterized protein n=1 Tax=Mytilinidion resinicola TaxID=574789 RepID=A0A6A6Y2L7_9PEZI|nr:uncharacterized protein BDZ99DRAFT_547564 [Mytilinidion resinicola]KAF2803051.1 hypothetical protein BDZ99DRAFT_547564 [Mytilinidion resinicola]
MTSKRKAGNIENELSIEQLRDRPLKRTRIARGEGPAASRALHDLPLNVFGGPHGAQHSPVYTNKYLDACIASTTSNGQPVTKAAEVSRNTSKSRKSKEKDGQLPDITQGQLGQGTHQIPVAQGVGSNPLPPPNSKAAQDGFPAFERHFRDSETAHQWRNSRTRAPFIHPNNDPTIPIVKADLLLWVEMLYKMIINRDDVRDHVNSDKYKAYARLAQTTSENIEAACHNLMLEVLNLCDKGFQLADPKLDLAKPGSWSTMSSDAVENMGDQDLQCFMRMVKICFALKHEKTICAEVMSGCFGDRWVRQFVNAPIEWRRRKGNNRRNNDSKPQRAVRKAEENLKRAAKKAEKHAAAELEQEVSNDDPGNTSATKIGNTKAEKQAEPSMTAVFQEAYGLGITIPDLYLGLLVEVDATQEPDASQQLPVTALPSDISLSDPVAQQSPPTQQLPAAHLPPIGYLAAPENRQQMTRRYGRGQSTINALREAPEAPYPTDLRETSNKRARKPKVQVEQGASRSSGRLDVPVAPSSHDLSGETATGQFQSAGFSSIQPQVPTMGPQFRQQIGSEGPFQSADFFD